MKTRRLTTSTNRKTVVGLQRAKAPRAPKAQVARLVAVTAKGHVTAELAARPGAAIPIRLGMALDRTALAALIEGKRRVLLLDTDDDETPWLVSFEREIDDPPAPVRCR